MEKEGEVANKMKGIAPDLQSLQGWRACPAENQERATASPAPFPALPQAPRLQCNSRQRESFAEPAAVPGGWAEGAVREREEGSGGVTKDRGRTAPRRYTRDRGGQTAE